MSMELNPDTAFADARPVARHCDELVMRGPRPEERAEALSLWRREFCRALSQDLEGLFAGERPGIVLAEPEIVQGAEVFARIGPLAANSLLRCGADDRTVLLSLDLKTAIALTDRSFGGSGKLSQDVPDQLPRSAALLMDQVATRIAKAIASASSGGIVSAEDSEADGDVIIRSESAARLKPFGLEASCAVFVLHMSAGSDAHWDAVLAMPSERLDALLSGAAKIQCDRKPISPDHASQLSPFAEIPLGLEAVLAEFELSLGRLESLAPGDQIPLCVARDIPLRLGTETIALGNLGTQEDRMALRITRFPSGVSAPHPEQGQIT
ncbi:hypothetical protein FGU71_03790 [Erythrobacter insulae]|uniref:Flagellar motor switch protein FliN-like C-terminal domain-containing protein n=1 Tax=Erythrobacter insulae TaxID=2584124 RepID=A0A547PA81_9SPHN|nr:flagellar motor switch protein FliM [Erythrobacter insulae]TRD11058.1 hypothetical protein FGU71_03790 [Erythrobacter insulae]